MTEGKLKEINRYMEQIEMLRKKIHTVKALLNSCCSVELCIMGQPKAAFTTRNKIEYSFHSQEVVNRLLEDEGIKLQTLLDKSLKEFSKL